MSSDNKQDSPVTTGNTNQRSPEGTDSREITRRIGDAGVIHTVTNAVMNARERPLDEFPPLDSFIDGDALESLWRDAEDSETQCTVTFRYAGCEVTVTQDRVRVVPRRESQTETTALDE